MKHLKQFEQWSTNSTSDTHIKYDNDIEINKEPEPDLSADIPKHLKWVINFVNNNINNVHHYNISNRISMSYVEASMIRNSNYNPNEDMILYIALDDDDKLIDIRSFEDGEREQIHYNLNDNEYNYMKTELLKVIDKIRKKEKEEEDIEKEKLRDDQLTNFKFLDNFLDPVKVDAKKFNI